MIFCSFTLSFTYKNLWRLKKEAETLPNFTTIHPVNCCLQWVWLSNCLFWKVTKDLLGRAFSVVVQDALRLLEVSSQRHSWLFTWQKEPEIAFQTVPYFHTFALLVSVAWSGHDWQIVSEAGPLFCHGKGNFKRSWMIWQSSLQWSLYNIMQFIQNVLNWAEVRSGLCTGSQIFPHPVAH